MNLKKKIKIRCFNCYPYMHTYLVLLQLLSNIYTDTYIYTCIRTYIYTFIRTYTHTHTYIYIYIYMHTYILTLTGKGGLKNVLMILKLPNKQCTYIQTICTQIHTYIHIQTHIHTHIQQKKKDVLLYISTRGSRNPGV